MSRFKKGDLVKINILKTVSSDGLTTARAACSGKLRLSETIDLEAYPSYYDFQGGEVTCDANEIGTVVSFIGRPKQIRGSSTLEEYDVYEIFIRDTICHIFSNNLLQVSTKDS